ncbi:unnamed protein product, partial [Porites lobata]
KGNRKQFEFNARLQSPLSRIKNNADDPRNVCYAGYKRQKLIQIADRSKDCWLFVQEYESDDLASNSEDEKHFKKAKNAAEKKRKNPKRSKLVSSKSFKSDDDKQLFRVALSYFQKGSYMISFDLKSGYPHIDTRADYQQFLGFAGKCIVSFVNQTFVVSARELPSFTGKILSAGAVFGNISRIMTRHCAISVVAAADWDTKFALDNYCVGEIQFWKSNLYRLNTKNIDLPPITSNYAIYSDVVPLVAAPT